MPFFTGAKTICSRFYDLLDRKKSNWDCTFHIIDLLSGPGALFSQSFHLDVIAQLHVYHPWHWWNVSFPESPHKTLIYKSLSQISPLAKLPSQAVDFRTQRLQSAAQRETSRREGMRERDQQERSASPARIMSTSRHEKKKGTRSSRASVLLAGKCPVSDCPAGRKQQSGAERMQHGSVPSLNRSLVPDCVAKVRRVFWGLT